MDKRFQGFEIMSDAFKRAGIKVKCKSCAKEIDAETVLDCQGFCQTCFDELRHYPFYQRMFERRTFATKKRSA